MFPEYILTNGIAGVSISTNITVLQLKAGTNGPIEILRFWLTQSTSTTSAQCLAGLVRKTSAATVTAAVAGTTLFKQNLISPTADCTLATNGTGLTASGNDTSDGEAPTLRGFNALTGLEVLFTPDERIIVPTAGIIALKLLAGATATWVAGIHFRELRGG
jgi:hypothetical protein